MIKVILPFHLRNLANITGDVEFDVPGDVTIATILDALESKYPMLCGTVRDHITGKRRPMVRFFACEEDWSNDAMDKPLPDAIASGAEPFWIVGAVAGG